MEIEQKYEHAFEELGEIVQTRVEKKRYTAMGYTSNLDLLCDFRAELLNQMLEEYLPDGRLAEMGIVDSIHTMEELLSTIVYYCSRGIGGEADIEDTRLVEECFPFQYGMGGTAVQAALALAEIGCPSLVHLTADRGLHAHRGGVSPAAVLLRLRRPVRCGIWAAGEGITGRRGLPPPVSKAFA